MELLPLEIYIRQESLETQKPTQIHRLKLILSPYRIYSRVKSTITSEVCKKTYSRIIRSLALGADFTQPLIPQAELEVEQLSTVALTSLMELLLFEINYWSGIIGNTYTHTNTQTDTFTI